MLQHQTNTPVSPLIPAAVQANQSVRTIVLERFILNDDMLLVQSSATCWVNTSNLGVDVEGLTKLYAEVVKLAKSAGVKISYRNKTKRAIQDVLEAGAVAELQTSQRLYGMLKAAWERKVVVGISSPASDDEELTDLSDVKNSMDKLTYRNKPLGKALSLVHELNERKQRLLAVIACGPGKPSMTVFL